MPLLYLALTYLLAAIPFGVVLTTLFGGDVDLRVAGSGNIGATNVGRVFGWKLAAQVLVLDALKGWLPVMLAPLVWPAGGLAWGGAVAMTAFVGHCFPIYLELRGGKGVATGAGAMLALAPLPTLLAGAVWGALLAVTGRSSVAALGATSGLVILAWILDPPVLIVALLLAIGVAGTHGSNIRRLVRGEEQEVIRPVRWGRRRADGPTPAELLDQDPGGGQAHPPSWRDPSER